MFFVVGGALAFFYEFLLLSKRHKSLADKILAVWMLMLGLHLFLYYFTYAGIDLEYPFLIGIGAPFPFVHSPFLYLYTAALTGRLKKWDQLHLLHFLPVPLFYLAFCKIMFLSTGEEKIAFVKRIMSEGDPPLINISVVLMIVLALVYLGLTFRQYRRHQIHIYNQLSYETTFINLHWLRNLLIGLASVWFVVILANVFEVYKQQDEAIYVTVVLFTIAIGYFGIRQGDIFTTSSGVTDTGPESDIQATQPRYAKSGLKAEDKERLESGLRRLMESEQAYLRENLSLPQLARELNTHSTYLSQVINESFQQNFYDFVNSYRVKAFQEKARDPENMAYTIQALAQNCGFASKASFNKAFKKFTGQTPSEYLTAQSR